MTVTASSSPIAPRYVNERIHRQFTFHAEAPCDTPIWNNLEEGERSCLAEMARAYIHAEQRAPHHMLMGARSKHGALGRATAHIPRPSHAKHCFNAALYEALGFTPQSHHTVYANPADAEHAVGMDIDMLSRAHSQMPGSDAAKKYEAYCTLAQAALEVASRKEAALSRGTAAER